MKKAFDFIGHLGMNSKIIEKELFEHGFEIELTDEKDGFAFRVYKSSPIVYHIHAKYRIESTGLFADSFTVY